MKKFLLALVALGLIALLAFLGVTKHLAEQRAKRLDKENLDAQARILDLEAELQEAKDQIAQLSKARESAGNAAATAAPQATSSHPSGTPAPAATAEAKPGALVKYAAAGSSGLTNVVRIEGTSSVHNWQVESHLIGGTAEFGAGFPPPAGAPTTTGPIDGRVSVFIPVRSLKSLKADGSPYSDAMDEIMYGKLLAEQHKRISYTLQTLTLKQRLDSTGALECEATGLLALAGQTNTVTMPVTITPAADGKLQFTGALATKMTDFKITPPAPSAGGVSIKTGDDVTLKFSWWVKPVPTAAAAK
jgi:hypothetical protein